MKLKTLKDLDYYLTNEMFVEEGRRRIKFDEEKHLIDIEELKAEAVKWVKDRMKILRNKTSTDLAKMKATGMIIDFEDFFNLTEEDLK